jgi:hypothetical protein
MSYVFDKVMQSVVALASGTQDLQYRLRSSYVGILSSLEETDFHDEELRKKFNSIIEIVQDEKKCSALKELDARQVADSCRFTPRTAGQPVAGRAPRR